MRVIIFNVHEAVMDNNPLNKASVRITYKPVNHRHWSVLFTHFPENLEIDDRKNTILCG